MIERLLVSQKGPLAFPAAQLLHENQRLRAALAAPYGEGPQSWRAPGKRRRLLQAKGANPCK